jgi:methanogenic corrinoid protein MtbC1
MPGEASQGCNRWLHNSLQSLRNRAQQKLSKFQFIDEHPDPKGGDARLASLLTDTGSGPSPPSSAIIPALEELESAWLAGRISYTDTIYGLWLAKRRLDGIDGPAPPMTRAGSAWGNVLLAAAPNSQHVFGLSIVTESFQGAGWHTTTLTDGYQEKIIEAAKELSLDYIGISVGHDEGLAGLSEFIALLRQESRARDVRILVGGNVFSHPTSQYVWLGADFVALNVEDALTYCSQQMHLNTPRH